MTAIREAGPDDRPALAALYRAFFAEDGEAPPAGLDARLGRILADRARHRVLLAAHRGAPAGFAAVTLTFGVEFGLCAEIEELFVAEPARGAGVGRALMETACAWCRAEGCGAVYVIVTPDAEEARGLSRFYHAVGLRPTGRQALFLDMPGAPPFRDCVAGAR